MQEILETLRTEWKTTKAKACVDIAAKLLEQPGVIERVTEARHWVSLARMMDNDGLEKRVKALEDASEKKRRGRGAAERMKARKQAAGGNVVEFPAKDGI